MKKFLLSAVACLAVVSSATAGADKLYGLGTIDGWNGWSNTNPTELEKVSDGVFTWSGSVSSVAYFAFTSVTGDWSDVNANRYSGGSKDVAIVDGENNMVLGADFSWKILPGSYTFNIDTNTLKLTVSEQGSVEKVYSYAIHGQLDGLEDSDWADYMLNKENDDLWTAELCPAATGGSFGVKQILNGASQSDWYSAGVTFDGDNKSAALTGGDNCTYGYPAGTTVKASFVPSTKTLTIEPTEDAGVEVVAADAVAEAVYYNLQGVRVANPENGMYIRVQAGKAAKVVL